MEKIFRTPMITDTKSGSYVPVEGPLLSGCCGASDGDVSYDGPSFSDIGICPECRDHCDFVREAEDDADPVNTVLSKMEAYVFVAMLASFSLGALTWELVK